jgi:hypothetical protein
MDCCAQRNKNMNFGPMKDDGIGLVYRGLAFEKTTFVCGMDGWDYTATLGRVIFGPRGGIIRKHIPNIR